MQDPNPNPAPLRVKASDFAIRRLVDAMGGVRLMYNGQKKQAPIHIPQEYGLEGFSEKYVTSGDGSNIGLWHKPAADPDKPTYVVFHGRSGHWGFAGLYPPPRNQPENQKDYGYRHKWLKALADTGAGVVAVHTRGFGLSANPNIRDFSEEALSQDMEAIDGFLQKNGIPPQHTVVAGESLGGGLAALLSDKMTENGRAPSMLGLINTFSDMSRAIHESITAQSAGPLKPLKWASEENMRNHLKNPLDTAERLGKLPASTRLYIAHAPDDEVLGQGHSKRLLEQRSQSNNTGVTFRALVGNFLSGHTRRHTGWSPEAVAQDMDKAFRSPSISSPSFSR